jgi:hypothetical protein
MLDSVPLNFEFGCRLANPGNANLPIGDGAEAQNANREIGVPRRRLRSRSLTFLRAHFPKLGHDRMLGAIDSGSICDSLRGMLKLMPCFPQNFVKNLGWRLGYCRANRPMGFDPCGGMDSRTRFHRALGRASLNSGNLGRGFWLARRGDRQLDGELSSSPQQRIRWIYHHVPGQLDVLLQRDTGSCVGETQFLGLIHFSWAFGLLARA